MTVIFIKRECDRHPGCYTLTDKCEECVTEEFRASIAAIFSRLLPASGSSDGNNER